VKWQTTPAFDADLRRLSPAERTLFREVVRESFVPAAERRARNESDRWPGKLRVKKVAGAAGIWEMTWSFSGPDGRATFEWITIDSEPAIRWRRVGGHEVFRDPAP
jgi:hypothetical protein